MTKKTTTKPTDAEPKRSTIIYLTESMSERLGRYLLEKHKGKTRMRNTFILEALDAKLAKEGY